MSLFIVYIWLCCFSSLLVDGILCTAVTTSTFKKGLKLHYDRTQSRIVGGRPAKTGSFPYQECLNILTNKKVSIRLYGIPRCGGSIITSYHILTAAHCMFTSSNKLIPFNIMDVVAGQLNLSVTKASVAKKLSKCIIHEEYNVVTNINDIAILMLKKKLSFSAVIAPVPMRKTPIISGKCVVSGWGKIKYGGKPSKILLEVDVAIVELSVCQEMYKWHNIIKIIDGMVCAGTKKGGKDGCQGDSGGPLVCFGQLTGIVSSGQGCGNSAYPGVYTDVSKYRSWVTRSLGAMKKNKISSSNEKHFMKKLLKNEKNGFLPNILLIFITFLLIT